ncbi:MAG: ROK family protein [Bacteroidota bacterium]
MAMQSELFGPENLWGIDLGGTKVEGVILRSANDPTVLWRDRLPTGAEKGYDHITGQITKVVGLMKSVSGQFPAHIGMATPGIRDPRTGTMKNCNSTALNGRTLQEDLEAALGTRFLLANDANCFALAEARMGVVRERFPEARVVFGVIMGTGVGGGVVVDGRVISGLNGNGGEWGHNFLDESGLPCYCGKSGCVEQVLSGPALQHFYTGLTGTHKTMQEIYAAFLAGNDAAAAATMERLTTLFAKAISVVINILDPDVIVVGGGVGNIEELYSEGRDGILQYIFNNRLDTPIVKPMLGDSAGVFGAAYLQ